MSRNIREYLSFMILAQVARMWLVTYQKSSPQKLLIVCVREARRIRSQNPPVDDGHPRQDEAPRWGGCHHHPRSVRKISGHRPGRAMIFGSLYTDNLSADQYAGARDTQHDVSSLSRSCVQNNIYHRWRRPCDWDGGLYQTLINAPFSKAC